MKTCVIPQKCYILFYLFRMADAALADVFEI